MYLYGCCVSMNSRHDHSAGPYIGVSMDDTHFCTCIHLTGTYIVPLIGHCIATLYAVFRNLVKLTKLETKV